MGEGCPTRSEEHGTFRGLDVNGVIFHLELLNAVVAKNFDAIQHRLKGTLEYMKLHGTGSHAVLEYFVFTFRDIGGNGMARGIRQASPFDTVAVKLRLCETADKLEETASSSFNRIEA